MEINIRLTSDDTPSDLLALSEAFRAMAASGNIVEPKSHFETVRSMLTKEQAGTVPSFEENFESGKAYTVKVTNAYIAKKISEPIGPSIADMVESGDLSPPSDTFTPEELAPVIPPPPMEAGAPDIGAIFGGVTPPPPVAVQSAEVEVDSDNLPWDGRIHAEGKKKNKDGTWRARRNLDDATATAVRNELRMAMGAPKVPTAATAPAVTPPPTPTNGFADVMSHVAKHMQTPENPSGALTVAELQAFAKHLGLIDGNDVGNYLLLQHRPDLLPEFRRLVDVTIADKARANG